MLAVQLIEPGRMETVDLPPVPDPGPGEARVTVKHIGICGTDLRAYRGEPTGITVPRILGHELGVEIESLGPDEGQNREHLCAGEVCCVEPYGACGHCRACCHGRPNCCHDLRVLGVDVDGGMCEQLTVPLNRLHRSHRLSTEPLALVEPLCIGAHAVERAELQDRERVLIVGAGPVGLAVLQSVLLSGAAATVVEVDAARRAFCAEHYRAVDVRAEWIADPTDERAPEVVFDCTGHPEAMARSFDMPAFGGRLVLVGHHPGQVAFDDGAFHERELTVLGSRHAEPDDFARIINLMENGRIDVTPWITHRATLAELPKVIDDWLDPASGLVKAVVTP